MIDISKRYLQKRDNDPPNLGNLIDFYISKSDMKKKDVAAYLGVLPTTLNQYFKQSSLQFGILWRICLATNQNFLMQLGEKVLKIPYTTQKEIDLQNQLAQKEEEIKILNIKLEAFREIYNNK